MTAAPPPAPGPEVPPAPFPDPAREGEFVLVGDSPWRMIEARLGLQPPGKARLGRRAFVLAAVTFLPALVLTLLAGTQGVFLADLPALGTLLVSLPLLIVSDRLGDVAGLRLVRMLQITGVVGHEQLPELKEALRPVQKLRRSWLIFAGLLVLVVITSIGRFEASVVTGGAGWLKTAAGGVSPAGWWYLAVALPVYNLYRVLWTYRILLWWFFLFRLSRLDLRLSASHPDCMGGIAFLGDSLIFFLPLVLGMIVPAAMRWRMQIIGGEATLAGLQPLMIGLVVIVIVALAGPFVFFSRPLKNLRFTSELKYGMLAHRYVRGFEDRWLEHTDAPPTEELLGTGDIQSLADLGASYERVQQLRPYPVRTTRLIAVVAAAVVALLPAITAQVPLQEIIKAILKSLA